MKTFLVLRILCLILITSCSKKHQSKTEKLEGGDLRFRNKVLKIIEYKIDGKDYIDSIRKYQFHHEFEFTMQLDSRGFVDLRGIRTFPNTTQDGKKYDFDTSSCKPGGGNWELIPNESSFSKIKISYPLPLKCYDDIHSKNEKYVNDTLMLSNVYWNVSHDTGSEISLEILKNGKMYFKKILIK